MSAPALRAIRRPRPWPGRLGFAALVALVLTPLLAVPRGPQVALARPLPAVATVAAPEAAPVALQAELEALALGFGDPVGIAVGDLRAGWTAQVDGDVAFPQQSVSKIWVAVALLDGVDRGRWRLDDPVVLRDEDLSVFYQPIAQEFGPDGYATTLDDLLRRALVESDNAAADRLVRLVGGAEAVQATLHRKGLGGIRAGGEERRLQSAIAGLEWRTSYGQGRNFKDARARLAPEARDAAMAAYLRDPPDGATPAALARGLAALQRGDLLSADSTRRLINLMTQSTTGPQRLKAGLPPGWALAHKTGTGQDWRDAVAGYNDVGLITAPDGRTYAVAVMIRRTTARMPARFALMQAVSAAVVRQWRADTGLPAGPEPPRDEGVLTGLHDAPPLRAAR